MVEGIAVIPVFILFWLGTAALERMYTARMTAASMAATQALQGAGEGHCADQSISCEDLPGTEDVAPVPEEQAGLLQRLGGVHPLALVHMQTRAEVETEGLRTTSSVHGERYLLCNTKPVDGLMELVVADVKALLGL